jgi:hypothetical protein
MHLSDAPTTTKEVYVKAKALIVVSLAVVALSSLGLVAGAKLGGSRPDAPDPRIGPIPPLDTGAGEMLLVVLGGVYPTREEAVDASDSMAFGDLQGYYVAPVAQFQGFREQIANAGEFALVSVFRTEKGAREFANLATAYGYPARILGDRVRSLGGVYAGLGQESHPDGSGPLLEPIAESLP